MGVAVFIDFTDDDLHGLTLGVKNVFNNMALEGSPSLHRPHDVSPFKFPVDGDAGDLSEFTGESLENVGNPRANLCPRRPEESELHSRILFCHPHSLFGELDPVGGSQAKSSYGGFLGGNSDLGVDNGFQTFRFSGTCLRRLQVLPFMTKRKGDTFTTSDLDFTGGAEFDPYFPQNFALDDVFTNGTATVNFASTNYIVRGQGYLKCTFTQVEVD